MSIAIILVPAFIVAIMVVLCFVLIKKKFLAFLAANLIIFLAMAALTYYVYQDLHEMQARLPVEQKSFLLMHRGKLIGGFTAISIDDSIAMLDEKDINDIRQYAESHDYDKMLDSNYKIIIIDSDALAGFGMLELDNFAISEDEFFAMLDSDDAIATFVEMSQRRQFGDSADPALAEALRQSLKASTSGEAQFKAQMFAMAFGARMQKEGVWYMLDEFKAGNIIFYPETITFSLLKTVPTFIFKAVGHKLIGL